MIEDDPRLVAERDAKILALGPCPPWYRPLKRRRWRIARTQLGFMSVSRMTAIAREMYPADSVLKMSMRPSPFLSLLRKDKL